MALIGVCEDDAAIRKVLIRALREAGHEALVAYNGREALALLGADAALAAIVMDIGLPDGDGRDVVLALKSAGQSAPVLFLTAWGEPHHVLSGFAAGADDYLTKPFQVKELMARLDVLSRRAPERSLPTVGFTLDAAAHAVQTETGTALLTPTEFRMLAAITSRPGEVVRRRVVIGAAWPDGAHVSENTVDSFIRRVRTKLASVDAPIRVETVRGVGYTATARSAEGPGQGDSPDDITGG
jgi:two-component system OmpR family response regulator